jgi:ZIP family zinc transporter
MPEWLLAGFWGLFSGSALIIGALLGYYLNLKTRLVASVMAFGSGVLISALSFDLMDEAFKQGGFVSTASGFLVGAVVYSLAAWFLNSRGAAHRKRSVGHQKTEEQQSGSGLAIALGALLDGIPESIVIGLTLLTGKGVSLVAVIAIFISNLPEGLSSSSGMRKAGRSARYVFSVWIGITLMSGLAAIAGYTIFGSFSPAVISATTAVAAGAILTMLIDTMIPEAYEGEHGLAGLMTVFGFLVAFVTSKLGA